MTSVVQEIQPLISVIVPVYNVAEYLPQCVDSIINQTYKNLEIILVDDGSVDDCPGICDEYAKKDSRIRVIHKKNGGLSDARNAGLDICVGEWIGFVDGDDYIVKNMYEKLYESAVETKSDVSVCRHTLKGDNGGLSYDGYISKRVVLDSKEKMISLSFCGKERSVSSCFKCYMSIGVKLYKKRIFSALRFPVGKTYEDAFIILSIIDQASRIVILSDVLYYYRLRIGSLTNVRYWNENIWDAIFVYKYNFSIIKAKYPSKLNEGMYRLWWAYRTSIGLAVKTLDYKNHVEEIEMYRNIFRRNILKIFFNPFLSVRGRIDTILVAILPLGIYAIIRRYFD